MITMKEHAKKTGKNCGEYNRKIINPDQVPIYISQGYKIIDPHLHTSCSYDVLPTKSVTPQNLYRKMKAEGWEYVTFTDHDTIEAYEQLSPCLSGLVRGVEIKIKPEKIGNNKDTHTIHINVYELNKDQFNNLKEFANRKDFYGFIDYLKEEDLPYMLNHPTWPEQGETPNWKLLPDIIKEFDVIEAYNQGRVEKQNLITLKLAEQYGKGIVASSDSHRGNPIKATLVKGESFRECWENIKEGNCLIVPYSLDYKFICAEVNGWINQFIEIGKEKMNKKNYSIESGVKSLDWVIDNMVNKSMGRLKFVRRLNALAVGVLFSLAGYHLANSVYIRPQNMHAEQIIKMLSNNLIDKNKLENYVFNFKSTHDSVFT